MKEKMFFFKKKKAELFEEIINNKFPKNSIFNFLNLHSLYLFKHHKIFSERIKRRGNFTFIDGFAISLFLSIKKFKKISRLKGPDFADNFLKNPDLLKNKKHLFLGMNLSSEDLNFLEERYPLIKKGKYFFYHVPLLEKKKFDDSDIVRFIKKHKPNYVWVGVGNPRQEILSNDLAEKVEVDFFFNIGAGLDFILERKKRAPRIYQSFGLEWLYRLITDFNHSRKKVWRSFVALKYLNNVELK